MNESPVIQDTNQSQKPKMSLLQRANTMLKEQVRSKVLPIVKLVNILEKAPLSRSPLELKYIVSETKHFAFFQRYYEEGDQEIHKLCCQYMYNQNFNFNEIVFRAGEVGVYLPQAVEDEQETGAGRNQNQTLGTLVRVLKAGVGFGELALLNDLPRAATIKCLDKCTFGVLEKQYFNIILKQKQDQILKRKVENFQRMSYFSHWSFTRLQFIYSNFFVQTYSGGEFVYLENQNPDCVYFVQDGEFRVVKNFLNQQDKEQMEFISENYSDSFKIKGCRVTEQKSKNIQLSCCFEGEILGEIEIIRQEDKRRFGIQCVSKIGNLYMIDKKNFEFQVMSDKKTLSTFMIQIEKKISHMNFQIDEIKRVINKNQNYFFSELADIQITKDFFQQYCVYQPIPIQPENIKERFQKGLFCDIKYQQKHHPQNSNSEILNDDSLNTEQPDKFQEIRTNQKVLIQPNSAQSPTANINQLIRSIQQQNHFQEHRNFLHSANKTQQDDVFNQYFQNSSPLKSTAADFYQLKAKDPKGSQTERKQPPTIEEIQNKQKQRTIHEKYVGGFEESPMRNMHLTQNSKQFQNEINRPESKMFKNEKLHEIRINSPQSAQKINSKAQQTQKDGGKFIDPFQRDFHYMLKKKLYSQNKTKIVKNEYLSIEHLQSHIPHEAVQNASLDLYAKRQSKTSQNQFRTFTNLKSISSSELFSTQLSVGTLNSQLDGGTACNSYQFYINSMKEKQKQTQTRNLSTQTTQDQFYTQRNYSESSFHQTTQTGFQEIGNGNQQIDTIYNSAKQSQNSSRASQMMIHYKSNILSHINRSLTPVDQDRANQIYQNKPQIMVSNYISADDI